jgi:hypothetical protein
MQEIALSDNLQQIELEINWHKENAGKSIWEIGRRLNHVKENDLAHGEFGQWLEKIEINQRVANQFMKVASEIPNSSTYSNLGYNALYLIATLPEEEKQAQLERVEQGDNPTVRELQEVRRKLKESEERNKRLEERALQKEVVEKEVVIEKVPEDYEATKNLNSDLLNKNKRLNYDNENLQRVIKIKEHELKRLEDDSHEAIALKETIESLRTDKEKLEGTYKNAMELSSLLSEFENFFDEKMAPLRFKAVIAGLGTEFQLKKLRDMLTLVDSWLTEMNKVVPDEGRKIIEGEIING